MAPTHETRTAGERPARPMKAVTPVIATVTLALALTAWLVLNLFCAGVTAFVGLLVWMEWRSRRETLAAKLANSMALPGNLARVDTPPTWGRATRDAGEPTSSQ